MSSMLSPFVMYKGEIYEFTVCRTDVPHIAPIHHDGQTEHVSIHQHLAFCVRHALHVHNSTVLSFNLFIDYSE